MTIQTAGDTRRTRSLSKGFVDLIVELRDIPETVFDVIIVGSGYGGSIAAQQLADLTSLKHSDGTDFRIAVLERGSEYLPGMFPSAIADMPKHVRYARQSTGQVSGEREGLYDLRLGDDVNALVANGLGGGSLINAGVMIKPDFDSFSSALPQGLIDDLLKPNGYLDKAKKLLLDDPLHLPSRVPLNNQNTIKHHADFIRNPIGYFPLKYKRLEELAEGGKKLDPSAEFEAAEISVAMSGVDTNQYGINLNACVACGDCMTGCNVGAKASLNTNLLAQAKRDGVEIYTGASVLSLKRESGLWELEVVHTTLALRRRATTKEKNRDLAAYAGQLAPVLRARHVILAAGTFGSTEILLRSRSATLTFSNKLGERFSCNGDNIAAIHGLPKAAHCTDDEFKAIDKRKVGPTITGMVKVPAKGDQSGYLIQEFAVPAPLKRLFAEAVTTGKVIADLEKADFNPHGNEIFDSKCNLVDPCSIDDAAIERSLMLGIIGHDDASGVLKLPIQNNNADMYKDQEGALQIVWPQAREGKQLNESYERLRDYCKEAFPEATLIANPMWRLLPPALEQLISQPRGPVLTVHPLGGCPMGATADQGVVDDHGVVFNYGNPANDMWKGTLHVLDGSIISGSLGANPSLTISAIALRAVVALKADISKNHLVNSVIPEKEILPNSIIFCKYPPVITPQPKPTEIKVTERLVGDVCLTNQIGEPENFVLELTLRYEPKKIDRFMRSWGARTQKLIQLASNHKIFSEAAYVQIFRHEDWYSGLTLRVADDLVREQYAVFRANIIGEMTFFNREKSNYWSRRIHALWAYARNRGFRDFWQLIRGIVLSWLAFKKTTEKTGPGWCSRIKDAWQLSTRAGEVRLFDYKLEVVNVQPVLNAHLDISSQLKNTEKQKLNSLMNYLKNKFQGNINGKKRLTYSHRANPWKQLTSLMMEEIPLAASKSSVLKLDGRFVAKQGIPLIEIVQQENHANALLDMASLGLYMTRLMANIHLWSFRKPDSSPEEVPYVEIDRLPGAIAGLPEPEITEIPVLFEQGKIRAWVRLTRYKGTYTGATTDLNPVAFIHGYSISGNTFTHESLNISAVEFLWKNKGAGIDTPINRDVWVIDMRTSSALSTARLPWAYEEVALIDIPAALLHIKNVAGRNVDVVAHCVGAAMVSMAILTKADEVRTGKTELGVGITLTDAQLGVLEAFNGSDRSIGTPHPVINAIALSQKGPLIRYTDANIFRAYMMNALKSWIPEDYQFRVSRKPKVAEQLLDRILATLPYPDDEFDRENPLCFTKNTHWVSTRHRMDALYAQDFSACNMSDKTLNSLDELFGPINVETLAQTIHFVRYNGITNQRGRSVFVTIRKLRERWTGIPTFAFHGAENGLADVSTQDLLQVNFKAAQVPFVKKAFQGFGHQDVFIGKNSSIIFKELQAFFDSPVTYTPPL